jgi:hypothetical protein
VKRCTGVDRGGQLTNNAVRRDAPSGTYVWNLTPTRRTVTKPSPVTHGRARWALLLLRIEEPRVSQRVLDRVVPLVTRELVEHAGARCRTHENARSP